MQPARAGLKRIMQDLLHAAPRHQAAIFAWPLAAGAVVAARTEAVACSASRLQVRAADPAWKNELAGLAPQYITAIENLTGIHLEGIDFEIAPAPPQAQKAR